MRPIILYRGNEFIDGELASASKYFECTNRRPDIKKDDLVIPRYSCLPFYFEQEQDIKYVGAQFINSHQQHLYIADLQNYVVDLKELTPATWKDLQDLPDNTSFVLKGETNSKKNSWLTDMFAVDKNAAIEVYNRLSNDGLIGLQKIYIRQYVPLEKYFDGVNGMPVTKEFRFFVAYGEIISGAFYWQNYIDDIGYEPNVSEVPVGFLDKVIKKIGDQCNFYVIDVAKTQSGDWIVVELNDGSMSGLSCNKPEVLYKNLYNSINKLCITTS